MTRCERAAQIASRNSCRSSARGSRSPGCGSAARMSLPPSDTDRGNDPSSMPMRQTTRNGIFRMGRIAATAIPPASRSGNGAYPVAASATSPVTSGRVSSVPGSAPSKSPVRAAAADASSQEESPARSRAHADSWRPHVAAGWGERQNSHAASRMSTSSRSADTGAASWSPSASAGATPPTSPASAPSTARPRASRSRALAHVLAAPAGVPCSARCGESRPHRTLAPEIKAVRRSTPSRSNPKRCATSGAARKSVTSAAVIRPDSRVRRSSTVPSTGFVLLVIRSAIRTRRSRVGPATGVPAVPNTCATSGPNRSRSVHITRMSLGSRLGSADSRWSTSSRSASTWRRSPEQECTEIERSTQGVSPGPCVDSTPASSRPCATAC